MFITKKKDAIAAIIGFVCDLINCHHMHRTNRARSVPSETQNAEKDAVAKIGGPR